MKKLNLILLSAMLLTGVSVNAMPVLDIDNNGYLHGASGVDVGGKLYDVSFVNGTCYDIFDGCDESSDFAFTTLSTALEAASALLDQVFVDLPTGQFDSVPGLTAACINAQVCSSLIPYDQTIRVAAAFNHYTESLDAPERRGHSKGLNTHYFLGWMYAKFTPHQVTEPQPIALLALAVAVMGWQMRHRV